MWEPGLYVCVIYQYIPFEQRAGTSNECSDLVPALMEGMAKTKTPSWYEMVKTAKEMGDVKIHACSLMTGVMGLKKEDLDPIVDDIVGAASFMQEVQGEQVIFI